MGYYRTDDTRKKKYRWLFPLLLGVVFGVILVMEVIPAFQQANSSGNSEPFHPNFERGSNIINTSVQVDVSTQITEVVEEVTPAVVGVTNIQQAFDFREQDGMEAGTGSGVIYKVDGNRAYVVTNHHVVAGADMIEVVLYDGKAVPAELVGSDLFSDLAVLVMDADVVEKVIDIGSSGTVKVGEPAIAIGNPLGHMFSSTVTQGVISGTERTIPQDFDQDGRADWQAEVIQTDAAINPGNSGGALINIYGQLIGINSMKINQEAVEGIGFSIPIDYALPIMEELEEHGRITRPYIGVEIYSLDEIPQAEWKNTLRLPDEIEGGVYVWSVDPRSPADAAGIQRLDVITEVDGKPVMNMIDLRKILYQEKEIGDKITLVYYRNGEKQEAVITLSTQY